VTVGRASLGRRLGLAALDVLLVVITLFGLLTHGLLPQAAALGGLVLAVAALWKVWHGRPMFFLGVVAGPALVAMAFGWAPARAFLLGVVAAGATVLVLASTARARHA
jgi:hypothetical protein